jgi:hypothetical protein
MCGGGRPVRDAPDVLADVYLGDDHTRGGPEMTRSMVMRLGLAVAGLGLAGCGTEATEEAWSKEAAQYAIYATRIPLYPGTKIVDAMGSERIGVDAASSSYGMT